jgi:cytochrome c3-like protein/cytochrome c7-like protein
VSAKWRDERFALAVAAQALAAVLLIAIALPAQQASRSEAPKQEVPNNPLHPSPPEQPIPYSHKTHLAAGLSCQFCHSNPDPGNQMTFPATEKCMTCHATIAKNKPSIRKLAEFAKTRKPIPWARVYVVLSGVSWTHRKHLEAGVKCEACHGPVAQMDAMAEVTSVVTMGSCINCHELHKAQSTCITCHAWPSAEPAKQ